LSGQLVAATSETSPQAQARQRGGVSYALQVRLISEATEAFFNTRANFWWNFVCIIAEFHCGDDSLNLIVHVLAS
jgi:hypothetical protein